MRNCSTGSDRLFQSREIPAAHSIASTSEALTAPSRHSLRSGTGPLAANNSGAAADELEKAVKLQPSLAMAHFCWEGLIKIPTAPVRVEQFQPRCASNRIRPWALRSGVCLRQSGTEPGSHRGIRKRTCAFAGQSSGALPAWTWPVGGGKAGGGDQPIPKKPPRSIRRNPVRHMTSGKALLLAGQSDAAVIALQRAIALKPTDPSPHYQLARALEKIGKTDQARQECNASRS